MSLDRRRINDKTWYPEVLEQMVSTLDMEQLQNNIFVAEAALPTKDNHLIYGHTYHLIVVHSSSLETPVR